MHETDTPAKVASTDELGQLPEGDRFANALKFRRLGEGGGDVLYECWGDAVRAYAAEQVAAERERWALLAMAMHRADDAYGAGFYQQAEWLAAYEELRRMAGMS